MGMPVEISLLCLLLLAAKVSSQHITGANDDVRILTNDNSRVLMEMDENNHDFDDETTARTLLFIIENVSADDTPYIQFLGAFFSYSLEQNGTTYNLYATQSFDYEKNQRNYRFNVLVSSSYYPVVTFSIINIDDEPPSLTPVQCRLEENTIFTVSNSSCYSIISDPDGWLSKTTFTIHPNRGGENDIFALEFPVPPADAETTANVYLTVRQMLNFQSVTFYLFNIEAKDGAGHSTTPSANVTAMIDVIDLPDTPPEWITPPRVETFDEQTEQTFYVKAQDGDYGCDYAINYTKLWEQEEDEDGNYISIDETGMIKVRGIDRDRNDISSYSFIIMAFEIPNAPLWNITANVTFYINDIDNNPPLIRWIMDSTNTNVSFDEIPDKTTSLSFLENYNGDLDLTIYIKDIDVGENARFSVELEELPESTEKYTSAFMIVPSSGNREDTFRITVRNATYLDYEVEEWIHIKFNVLTIGKLDATKVDRMLVDITLIDYNDELPIFNATEYEVPIKETTKNRVIITQITATDRDAEDKILSHSLVGSTYTNRVLGIEEDTGRIYVNVDNAFDYDTVNPIFVQIRATDKANHATTVPLTINLLDVNNKAPTISTMGNPINIDENQISNTYLITDISATDMDTTAELTADIDWSLSYAMKNSRRLDMKDEAIYQQVRFIDLIYTQVDEGDDTNKDIKIDLIVNANNPDETTPDFELFDSLFIYVNVTDWNTDPEFLDRQNTSAIILISINDINDNTPFFPEASLPESERENRTVQENAPANTSVSSIVAIDLDVDDTVTYACEPENPDFDWLDINPSTGAFSVKAGNLIDADTHKTFYFNYSCKASDDNETHTSEPLLIHFYIIDTNNKPPVVSIPSDVYVDERSIAGTVVSVINASDADRDIPFHTVECSFNESSSCFNSFTIDNNVVIVKIGGADLNRDEGQATYDCAVTCQDNPDRLQNDLTFHAVPITFTIHLNDINNHIPAVLTKDLAVLENKNQNDLIGIIYATDIDEGDNAEIDFSITKVVNAANQELISDLFDIVTDDDYYVNLTHKRANLIALQDLKGKYGTYTVTILVADRGTPPLPASYEVTVEVEKFNFEAPRFIFPATENQAVVLLTVQEINSQLVLFRSEDTKYLRNFYVSDNLASDVCDKWDIKYSLEQTLPEGRTIFTLSRIDACSSQLQVNDYYSSDSVLGIPFNLKITASVKDGEPLEGEAPYSTSRSIIINFLDNSQKPVFSDRTWVFDFYEEDADQSITLENKASYEVEDDTLPIYYYLVTSDSTIESLFAVDSDTGDVSLKAKLDYETDESFSFQIVASNDTSPTSNNPNSYLDVTCNVIDINDNVPQWIRDVFFGAVMSGYIRNTPILTVQATDADKIDQGKLTYFINGSIDGVGSGLDNVPKEGSFLLSETTGEIRLNFQVDSTMSGHFDFDVTVWDVVDPYLNGPHWNTTGVTIFIITDANTVSFRFFNSIQEVQNQETEMLQVISNVLSYDAFTQNIDKENQNGVDLDNQTFASLYFINNTNAQAIESDTILRLVSDINLFSQLVGELRNQTGLILLSFPSTGTAQDNLEDVLRAWLVGVSVVLGALCLILLVTFILKTRELNNRITNLTMRKFGSQESGLNRLGISAPTTNKHAIEGSNPIFNLSSDEIKKDLREYDEVSMRSGDSDLIGIEDSPEFDYKDNKLNDTSEYI